MRSALICIVSLLCGAALYAQDAGPVQDGAAVRDTVSVRDSLVPKGELIPMMGAFLLPLQERDSVLVGDQLLYGCELKGVREGTALVFPELPKEPDYRLRYLSDWKMDTLNVSKGEPKLLDLRGSVKIASFQEGLYALPQIAVRRMAGNGITDTLVFEPMRLEVKAMPVDTATFVPHDIKAQIRYPLTFREVLPWVQLGSYILLILWLVIFLIRDHRRKSDPAYSRRDPAHIVALRELDKFRGSRMWAPEQQKAFYSGVTDVVREYMSSRYDFGAMEMTTAEIFDEMKYKDAPAELLEEVKELFDRADFVKFAKYTASDEDNAKALPTAVRFVTETYQAELENEEKGGE